MSSGNSNSVQRFNGTNGNWLALVVTNGSGGLSFPIGLEFGPDGNLCVASYNNNRVLQFNPSGGAYLGDFVSGTNNGGIIGPDFMTFRPVPALSIARFDAGIVLTWPASSAGFRLQEATALVSNVAWSGVTNSVTTANGSNTVTRPVDYSGGRFFRLIQ